MRPALAACTIVACANLQSCHPSRLFSSPAHGSLTGVLLSSAFNGLVSVPNCAMVEAVDPAGRPSIWLITLTAIQAGTELLMDYGASQAPQCVQALGLTPAHAGTLHRPLQSKRPPLSVASCLRTCTKGLPGRQHTAT